MVNMLSQRKRQRGYILVNVPNHPNCYRGGWVFEHRMVMEKMLGRYLKKGEVVHHKNGIRSDNREDNLQLCKNSAEHNRVHNPPRFCKVCGDPHFGKGFCAIHYAQDRRDKKIDTKPCPSCGRPINPWGWKGKTGTNLCRQCRWPSRKCKLCDNKHHSKGLCRYHYEKSISMIPCDKCGKLVWKTGYKSKDGTRMCHKCRFSKE